jgi:hypothetical protein
LFDIVVLSTKTRSKSREEYLGFSVRKQKHNILGTNVANPLGKREFGVMFAANARRIAFPNGRLPEVKKGGTAEPCCNIQ